VARH
jgi:hypothetical protein